MLLLALYRTFNWIFQGIMNFITHPVDTLPGTMETALTYFATVIGQIIHIMPWMEVVWSVFLIAMAFKVTLWTIQMILFMYRLIRG